MRQHAVVFSSSWSLTILIESPFANPWIRIRNGGHIWHLLIDCPVADLWRCIPENRTSHCCASSTWSVAHKVKANTVSKSKSIRRHVLQWLEMSWIKLMLSVTYQCQLSLTFWDHILIVKFVPPGWQLLAAIKCMPCAGVLYLKDCFRSCERIATEQAHRDTLDNLWSWER